MTIADDCDSLRPTLATCECGSRELIFQHWRCGLGAVVYCKGCGLGSPAKQEQALIVNLDGDTFGDSPRATKAAHDAWNAFHAGRSRQQQRNVGIGVSEVTMLAIARGQLVRRWGNWPVLPGFFSCLPYLPSLMEMR